MTASAAADAPCLRAVIPLAQLLEPGRRALLHAGPPFAAVAEIPRPIWHSMCTASVYEGWAADTDEAAQTLSAEEIDMIPAQDLGVSVPLCGIGSPSMMLVEVGLADDPTATYSVLHEGPEHALRLGILDPKLPAHHRWLDGEFADWLARLLREPLHLYPLIAASLEAGDDGHSRTIAGSARLTESLLARIGRASTPDPIVAFLTSSPGFALNIWMATAAYALRRAASDDGDVVSCAGGNGVRFGIKIGSPDGPWTTMPAPRPTGLVEPQFADRSALGAVGDSPLVDCFGLGGMALEYSPAAYAAVGRFLPQDARQRPEVLLGAGLAGLGGKRSILSSARILESGKGPLLVLGMIDAAGEAGRIGGGAVELPVDLFRRPAIDA
jgi:hypothetical protein